MTGSRRCEEKRQKKKQANCTRRASAVLIYYLLFHLGRGLFMDLCGLSGLTAQQVRASQKEGSGYAKNEDQEMRLEAH